MSVPQALVLWSRENKLGTVDLSCVPPNSRFANAITPVMFGPSKKYFPAKVILISNDEDELERKATEVEQELERQLQQVAPVNTKNGRVSRKRTNTVKPGTASDREIASAVGSKPPVPKVLQDVHQSELKSRKEAKMSYQKSQDSSDRQVLSQVRRSIFQENKQSSQASGSNAGTLNAGTSNAGGQFDKADSDSDNGDDLEEENGGLNVEGSENSENQEGNCWCGCKPCTVLEKYDKPEFGSFLREISDLFNGNSQSKKVIKFLELLPIPENVKKVELKPNCGIFISETDKDQLKVDYRNKPAALAKETLFKLYGKCAFQNVTVTGRGSKGGTYTIPDNVKKAVTGFVNKYVDKDKQMTTLNLVAMINKRAPEWRKRASPQSSKSKGKSKKSNGNRIDTSKVISTSPFKVTPTKQRKSPAKSPLGSPQRPTAQSFAAMLSSPRRQSPGKSLAAKSPRNLSQLSQNAPGMGPPFTAQRAMTPRPHLNNNPSNSGSGHMEYFMDIGNGNQSIQGMSASSNHWAPQGNYFQPWSSAESCSDYGQSYHELQPWSGSHFNGGNNNCNSTAYA